MTPLRIKGVSDSAPDLNSHIIISSKIQIKTLRFNFRGVGGSEGRYDEGAGERNDVKAAVSCLARMGIRRIDLAGYSFGAWVNARTGCTQIDRMVMISPPVAFIDFWGIGSLPCLKLVVAGDRDLFAPVDRGRESIRSLNAAARFEVIEGADHFYGQHASRLESVLLEMLSNEFP